MSMALICSSALYAQEHYQRCSEIEINQLINISSIQKMHLSQKAVDRSHPDFQDCLIINLKHALLALSQASDNAGNYQLDLFLIQRKTQKLIQHYHHPEMLIPQTRLENIKFDLNAYSNIQNQHVISLAFNNIHIGGVSSAT